MQSTGSSIPINLSSIPSNAATGPTTIWRSVDARATVPDSVFVIMAFQGEGMNDVLAIIREVCQALSLNANRADDDVGSELVIVKIADQIEKAELIICDLTYERPNVYYELGYAHGVGNRGDRVLLIAREKTEVHFDIGSLRIHKYSSPETLQAILQRNLPEMLHRCRSQKTREADQFPSLTPNSASSIVPNPPLNEAQPKR